MQAFLTHFRRWLSERLNSTCKLKFHVEDQITFIKKNLQFHFLYDSIVHGSLVKRLRRRPLTAETRVRFPYGLLKHLHLMQVPFCYLNILFYLSHKPNCKLESAASLLLRCFATTILAFRCHASREAASGRFDWLGRPISNSILASKLAVRNFHRTYFMRYRKPATGSFSAY